jgi:type I restriction enzyme R subunit
MTNLKKNLNEAAFEEYVEKELVERHGYISRKSEDYNKDLAMDDVLLIEFLERTQKEKLEKLRILHGAKMKEKLLQRIDSEISKRGILNVFRKGVDQGPVHFDLMYFLPVSGLNKKAQKQYRENIFSVMRQVYFSKDNSKSIDLGIFINGLPISTLELKNEITGQTVENAKRQYRTDRSCKEKLLTFKRCLAHFAVDTSEVFMTTKLAEEKTFFLPFNRGNKGGKGNPVVKGKHKTFYLWEEIFSRGSWSDLIQNFITVVTEERTGKNGKKYEEEVLIFPRFHQRDVVLDVASSVIKEKPGKNYLIQHSAGSGKSMTIAWSAYRLAQLHNEDNEKVFDSVFVVTDRRSLDKQLRETVETFQPVSGFLYTVKEDKGAKTGQLIEAIESGARVVTTTIHVFPYVAKAIGDFPGKRFAILIDEAHSSQGGETSRALNEVLQGATDEEFILQQLKSRKQGENISYLAFTATPRQETLERFGEKTSEGFVPFSLYSMRQAIEEGFIVDVLQNYTTYRQYFKILKKIEDNPELPRSRALSAIRRFIRIHPETISQKVAIIVEHFNMAVAPLLEGEAKAMIVTNSRESAVRYKLAMDKFLADQNLPYKSMIAFSDEINIDGSKYTESGMNGIPDSQTVKEFNKYEYKFLIVANKHQTGFDQPLLCGMYVDKMLSGVNAVQTLSRLNRMYKGKSDVFVLDFANTTEDIKEAFDDYYTTTILSEGLDINVVNDTVMEIDNLYKISDSVLIEFVKNIMVEDEEKMHQLINAQLDKVVEDVLRIGKEGISEFRSKASFYIKLYPYAESVFGYKVERHEKLYWFLKYFLKKLPRERRQPLSIDNFLDAENIKIVLKEKSRGVGLSSDVSDVYERQVIPGSAIEEGEKDVLEEIIRKANEEWGAEFGKEQVETLEQMQSDFAENEELQKTIEVNRKRKNVVSVKFENVFDKKLNEQYELDKILWETISSNKELKSYVRGKMLDSLYLEKAKVR